MPAPPAPPGYTEAEGHDPEVPGLEVGMLVIFTLVGWFVQQQQPVEVIPTPRFLIVALATVVCVEIVHEGIHVVVLRLQGIEADIHWSALSVVPTTQFVERRAVMFGTVAPAIFLTMACGAAYLVAAPGILAIALGLAVAVNGALSVLDLAIFYYQFQAAHGALYSFELQSGNVERIWVFEPASSD